MNYTQYKAIRRFGFTAQQCKYQFHRMFGDKDTSAIGSLMKAVIGSLICATISKMFTGLFAGNLPYGNIWITSPSGNTDKLLPIPLAFRIIRKHDWYITETEPVKPPITINRMDALKIFLRGNK